MSLTLRVEQRLTAVGLVVFYDGSASAWKDLAKKSHDFVIATFPKHAIVRQDDLKELLIPLLEVNKSLGEFLKQNKLTQRYWVEYFAELILDRTWQSIHPQR